MELKKAIEIIKDIDTLDDTELQEAYKTVLQELERLQKENEELKYLYNKALTDIVVGVDLDNTYISKEKIMKYKKEAENAECKSALEAICIGAIIGVLDGLLEE
ncbi:MAG: hypothetical protein J6C46_11480 [Clostridia bacterium]|nr:hypothetical protein [Clostridia bacterium]